MVSVGTLHRSEGVVVPELGLSFDEVVTTTRAVRRRLDFDRPVEPELLVECLDLAVQAPTPGGQQSWRFVVVTDAEQRRALGDVYRRGADSTGQGETLQRLVDGAGDEATRTKLMRAAETTRYLTENIHRAPALVVPCVEGRPEGRSFIEQASLVWGAILPAAWSFMLAARSRGLGTVFTTLHLAHEEEAAEVLGIPHDSVTQAGLIPVAHTKGTDFKPAGRTPARDVVRWNRW